MWLPGWRPLRPESFQMVPRFSQTGNLIVPFLLFAFLVCGVGGLYCPMPATGADTSHSQPASHHSTSISHGECPDQLKSSEGQSKELNVTLLPIAGLTGLADIFNPNFLTPLFYEAPFKPFSYPPLFLLFSVFRN